MQKLLFSIVFYLCIISISAQSITFDRELHDTQGLGQFGYLNTEIDVAVTTTGNILVTNGFDRKFSIFNNDGTIIKRVGTRETPTSIGGTKRTGFFYEPWGVTSDATGNIYVVDKHCAVHVFDANGIPVRNFSVTNIVPTRIQVDNSQNIYIGSSVTSNFLVYNNVGVLQSSFNIPTTSKFAVNGTGSIYTYESNLVKVYSTTGSLLFQFDAGSSISSLDIAPNGNLYVAVANSIQIRNATNGTLIQTISISETLHEFDVDANGNIYAGTAGGQIKVFNNIGGFVRAFGSYGGNGQLGQPTDVDHDANGNIYVTCLTNDNKTQVQILNSNYQFIRRFTIKNSNDWNETIGVDDTGNVYIYDAGFIKKFNNLGTFVSQFAICCVDTSSFIDIDIDDDNNIYTFTSSGIRKYNQAGILLFTIGNIFMGGPPPQSDARLSIRVLSNKEIYVFFRMSGYRIPVIDVFGQPEEFTITSGYVPLRRIYMTSLGNNFASPAGFDVEETNGYIIANTIYDLPYPQGTTETFNGERVKMYHNNGVPIDSVNGTGWETNKLRSLYGLSVHNGKIAVAELWNDRVQVFNIPTLPVVPIQMEVKQNTSIISNNTGNFNFGTSTVPVSFRLTNIANRATSITSINIIGTHASDFTVLNTSVQFPYRSYVSSFVDFTVKFQPMNYGNRTAILNINTSDGYTYQFALIGNNPKLDQTITFNSIPTKTFGDASFTISATGGASGNPITFTSSNTSVATILGNTVTIVGGGTTNITASQEGNESYNPATPIIQSLIVNKANQTINFESVSSKIFGDIPFTLNATSSSNLSVSYTSSNTSVATISGNIVTIIGAGTTNITASQAGNDNYNPATDVVQTLVVDKANQMITFNPLPNKTFGNSPFTLSATSSSNLSVSYTSSNTSVATISGNTVTIVGAGNTNITASQAGNDNYNSATPVIQSLIVNKANQTVNFESIPSKIFGDAPFALNSTSSSGLPVTFISSNPSVATISGNTVTIVGAGNTNITASQAGNDNYNSAAPVIQSLIVNKANQTVNFEIIPAKTFSGTPESFILKATSSAGLPVQFESSNTSVISILGNTATILATGITDITAFQNGDNNYNTANSKQTVSIILSAFNSNKNKQIVIFPNPTKGVVNIHNLENIENICIDILNVQGTIIVKLENIKVEKNIALIDIQGLAVGLYFLKIRTVNNEILTLKVLKQ